MFVIASEHANRDALRKPNTTGLSWRGAAVRAATERMRKDAERNRRKLIEAASATMRESGGDVPMEMIAERAGLTRGTLYRNFPHRQAMYEAVLENDLSELTARIAEDGEADPLAFIRRMTELMSVYDKFLVALSDMTDYDFAANQARMVEVLQRPLDAAKAGGALHQRLTGEDILLACRMLASPLHLDGEPDRGKALDRRLALMVRGLAGPYHDLVAHSIRDQESQ